MPSIGGRKTREVPIIFLTAVDAGPDYAFRGYAAGAVDYIAKPFDPWVLRTKVSVFVELSRKNLQLREQAELLRAHGAGDVAASGVLELSRGLSSVEEQVGVVSDWVKDEAATEALMELSGRVASLRAVLDSLG